MNVLFTKKVWCGYINFVLSLDKLLDFNLCLGAVRREIDLVRRFILACIRLWIYICIINK